MTEKEFDQRIDLINTLGTQASPLKEELSVKLDSLSKDFKDLSSVISERDKSFKEYLSYLRGFDFSEGTTAVSDIFPGIRTAAEMADPEEMLKKANTMKELSEDIDAAERKVNTIKNNNLSEMKKCLALMIEYLKQEDQLFELEIDLLKDLDSPYDIGQLSKNS